MDIFNINTVYKDYFYPEEYIKIIDLNLVDMSVWYLMEKEQVEVRINGLRNRYPKRKLIPFAKRDDRDDIACFEVGKGNKVQIIHDFASDGYEQRIEYESFWDWFRDAIEEMIQKEIEEDCTAD